jgi:tRNA 2-thiouridine synthesizing protein E
MAKIEYQGQTVPVDEGGYLKRMDDWNEEVALALAKQEEVVPDCPLTPEQMAILRFMRDYFTKFSSFPILRAVCKNISQGKNCTYEQFPDPIVAWRIAGLPMPTTEVFALIKHG